MSQSEDSISQKDLVRQEALVHRINEAYGNISGKFWWARASIILGMTCPINGTPFPVLNDYCEFESTIANRVSFSQRSLQYI